MIHIEQDQQLKDEPQMKVAVPTGDYNETDLIECYKDGEDPNTPTAMYQAQFISLGRNIYQQSEELTEDQLNALLANIPADQVINNRKMMDGKRPATKYVGKIVQRKGKIGKREARTDLTEEKQQATTTPPIVQTNPDTTATTTATSTLTDTNTSTTTPSFTPDTSTTTPSFTDTTATSTTTTTDDVISTSTPDTNISTTTDNFTDTTSTSTPALDESTTTLPITPASPDQSPSDTTSTSSEIVAFAKSYTKKKILKRLNL
jgi:hypothetical protein